MRTHISTCVRVALYQYFRKDSADVYSRDIGNSSLSGKELQAVNESVKDVANDCARAHNCHSALIQSPLSDGGALHCMENVMASDTSLYFEGLHG